MSNLEEQSTSGSNPAIGTDPTAVLNKRRRGVRVTYAAAVALGLAVGGGAVAGAATSSAPTTSTGERAYGHGGPQGFSGTPPATFGTVASVGTDTFTLTAHDGTKVTVDVSGTTTYLDPSVSAPTFTDVKAGDHVAVFGTDTNNTVAATKVAVGGPGGIGGHGGHGGPGGPGGNGGPGGSGGGAPAAFGTVASVGTDTFTLTSPDGTKVIVDVGSSTSYMEFGKTSASIANVTVGAHVVVFGTDADNTVTATKVGIGSPGGGSGGPGGMHGPAGQGGWPPASSTGTSSSSSTGSGASTSGSNLS